MRRLLLLVLLALAGAATRSAGQEEPAPRGTWLQPGDVLRLSVWREADLNGDFVVDESGYVTLPMLGRRRVTERAVEELRGEIIADFARQLNNPSVQITPLRRIFLLGQVGRPGVYTLDPTVSLAGAIALAGGATAAGDLRRIQVVRDGEIFQSNVSPAASLNTMDVRSGDQIFVGERGWFARNTTFLASALLSVTGLVVSILASR